jgi:hypothetical protein
MRKRSKHYCPKRAEIPMLVKAYRAFSPLQDIVDQIAKDGTLNCSARGVPMFRDLEDGQWYATAVALQGVIDHLEMYQLRHQVSLPLESLKEFHKAIEYAIPVSATLLAKLQRDIPRLQGALARSNPDDVNDILRQVQIKELMEDQRC